MKKLELFKNPIISGLCWGVAGGIVICLVENKLPNVVAEVITYLFFMVLSVITIYTVKNKNNFRKQFTSAFITFVIMYAIVYLYLVLVLNPHGSEITAVDHLTHIAIMIGIGLVSSVFLALMPGRA
jgi:hypothetical protein